MSTRLTVEQILALAPDPSAAKAGQGLASVQKWVTLGFDEQAAWGECQGSGQAPYQTQVDLGGPAFKCSCPSHKFPCKHALGLFLLLANNPKAFTTNAQPSWVSAWLASRARREEKKATAAVETEAKAPDPEAQAKRAAKRLERVTQGIADLDLWLCDLMRQGLASQQVQSFSFWEGMAARMVDAQASGIARLLRKMSGIPGSGDGWQDRLLEQLGHLYLLIERFRNIEKLPEAAQADIRTLVGWTVSQDELLAEAGVRDDWLVIGQRVVPDDRLRLQRTWLWGASTKRAALLLHYAHGQQPFENLFAPGMQLAAEIVFYPGAYPLRALVKTQESAALPLDCFAGYPAIAEAQKAYIAALTKFPWLEQFPLLLDDVYPVNRDDRWLLRDAAGQVLPVDEKSEHSWHLYTLSGGSPISVFGEWDGDRLYPLATGIGGKFYGFRCIEE